MKTWKIIGLFTITITFIFVFLNYSCNDNSKDKKITISIIGENSSTLQAMMDLKVAYEAENPSINLDFKPNKFEDALTKSNQDFANGTGLYDIVIQYNFTLSPSVRNGYVYLINDLSSSIPKEKKQFESDIFPDLWKEVGYYYKDAANPTAGSMMVSYPYVGISMVLMYNKPMYTDVNNQAAYLKKYGKSLELPTTWEELYKQAEFFTNKDKKTYGICMEGAGGGFLTAEWTNFLYGFGGKYMDKSVGWQSEENTNLLINSPEALNALTYYKSLKPFNSGTYADVDQFRQMQIMKEGKTAIAIAWTDMLYQTLKTEKGFDTTFGFTVIPGNRSILCGGAYFINNQSKHPKQAAAYIIDQMQQKNQIDLARKGLCSPLRTVYDDSIVKSIPYSNALHQSLKRGGIGLEAGPDADVISEVITTYIQKVWNNEMTPSLALTNAQTEIGTKRKEIFKSLVQKK